MRFVVVGFSGAEGIEPTCATAINEKYGGVCRGCSMTQQLNSEGKGTGLHLVKKPVRRVEPERVVREGSTGQIVSPQQNTLRLQRVWAVEDKPRVAPEQAKAEAEGKRRPELAFYRTYTEALLRRYLRISIQSGRVPSLLGRELFRGNVTSYRVHSFEDRVIFCFDVERRLSRLTVMEQQLIKRIGLQEYTHGEAAGMLGLSLRNCIRRYGYALDALTQLFLEAGMIAPLKSCQGGQNEEIDRSGSF